MARKKAWKPQMASLYAFSKVDYFFSFFNESTIFQNFGVREWNLSETKKKKGNFLARKEVEHLSALTDWRKRVGCFRNRKNGTFWLERKLGKLKWTLYLHFPKSNIIQQLLE